MRSELYTKIKSCLVYPYQHLRSSRWHRCVQRPLLLYEQKYNWQYLNVLANFVYQFLRHASSSSPCVERSYHAHRHILRSHWRHWRYPSLKHTSALAKCWPTTSCIYFYIECKEGMKEDIQKVSGFVFFGSRHTLRHNAKKYLISIHCRTQDAHIIMRAVLLLCYWMLLQM